MAGPEGPAIPVSSTPTRSPRRSNSQQHSLLVGIGKGAPRRPFSYSHSIVPGGFEVTSSTTRLTSGTWLVILFEMRASTS